MRIAGFILVAGLIVLSGCNKKEITVEVLETACEGFNISNPSYVWLEPECGGSNTDFTFQINFDYDGDEECLHVIQNDVRFYDIDGNEISTISHNPGRNPVDSSNVQVSGNQVSFQYCYQLASAADTALVNYIQVDWRTENEQEQESNTIGTRVNIPGAPVREPTSSDLLQTIVVDSKTIDIWVFDDAAEDGDIISINVNQDWVIENFMIVNAKQLITVTLQPGSDNFVLFYAVNEGSSSPNTLAGEIDDGSGVLKTFDVGLNTGETAYIGITCN